MASEADEEKKSPVVIGSGSALSPQGAAVSSGHRPDGAGQTQVPVVPVKAGASWSVSFNLFATAVTYLCAFLVTFAVTALVTFLWTNYDYDTDFIIAFFDVFNPCMFFDHYPANVVGTLVVTVWMAASVAFDVTLYQFLYLADNSLVGMLSAALLSLCAIFDLMFVNVLSAYVYLHHDEDNLPTFDKPEDIDTPTSNMIAVHASWYNVKLVFDCLLSLFLIKRLARLYSPFKVPLWAYCVLALNIIVQVLGMTRMMSAVLYGGQTEALKNREGFSKFQGWAADISSAVHTTSWNWMVALVFKLVVPRRVGVNFQCFLGTVPVTTQSTGVDVGCTTTMATWACCGRKGRVQPDSEAPAPAATTREVQANYSMQPRNILSITHVMLATLTMFTYLLQDSSTTFVPVVGGFRNLPYTYLFAPCWIFFTLMTLVGTGLTVVQRHLKGTMPQWRIRALTAVSCVWVLGMQMCLFIIVPEFDQHGFVILVPAIAIPVWCVLAIEQPTWRLWVWLVLWCGFVPAAMFSVYPAIGVLLLLACFSYMDATPLEPIIVVPCRITPTGALEVNSTLDAFIE